MSTVQKTLEKLASRHHDLSRAYSHRIVVCAGTGCIAGGSLKVRDALVEAAGKQCLDAITTLRYEEHVEYENDPDEAVRVSGSGCQGFCQMGPLVTIYPEGILYTKVKPDDAEEIIRSMAKGTGPVQRLLYSQPGTDHVCHGPDDIPFYQLQTRRVLGDCGRSEPGDLGEYVAGGGYSAAKEAWCHMQPEDVCSIVLDSGLRGRGGGGFPTGHKWQLTLNQPGKHKVVVCNGDEGDPGAFMDRSVMEGNPHSVIEGMLIAAHAIGADRGLVYVRAEYPLAVSRMHQAVIDAGDLGLLGMNVMSTGRTFDLEVMEGAGAFVCGEETALLASVAGRRGMPSPKPPFPSEKGLDGQPTVINNVETLASVPFILREGAHAYRRVGTDSSPGTKTFALTGHVANTGLIEVPFGTTLRQVVETIGGGVTDNRGNLIEGTFKAVQIGGPSGGCLTQDHLDLPLDFDSLGKVGAMVGSGGLVVMNQHTCMVKVARFFMQFTQNESCGKCVPCREGTRQMLALLDDIIEGRGTIQTLELLERTARTVGRSSLCGLGKTAPSPVLSTLQHFREEYEAHVLHDCCPAGQCEAFAIVEIDGELCRGCMVCKKKCPVDAISGERKEKHVIDPEKCIRCGACLEACKFNAILGL